MILLIMADSSPAQGIGQFHSLKCVLKETQAQISWLFVSKSGEVLTKGAMENPMHFLGPAILAGTGDTCRILCTGPSGKPCPVHHRRDLFCTISLQVEPVATYEEVHS